ncbi:unnamed protein product [Cuscuta campestris]|uniref:Transposase MuDR plant domain-containing protein n=1 Tax=Cuscuta campestris TaxID=132261 RepID=A0A484KYF6_9ASTE|nr:unnamed protein product [Cuscuta campestris]
MMAVAVDSSFQNGHESTITSIEQWADNLLVTPGCPSKSSRNLEFKLGSFNKSKLPVRKQPRRPDDEVSPLGFRDVDLIPPNTEEERDVVDSVRTPKKRKKNSIGCGRKEFEITELNVKLFAKELKGLEAYDIPSLCKPQITPLDLFFEEVMPPNETDGAEEEDCSEDDDEGSQFDGDEEECSSSVDVSLDEESHTDEELDVDADTNNRMKLGHVEEDEDGSGSQLIVDKMAMVFNTGRLWIRSTNEKVELREGDIFSSKKDFLRVMRDYIIQKGISLRKIKNDKRKYTQTCANEKCKFRIHASVLVDGHSWMIKTLIDGHVCSVKEHHKRAGASWVATHLLEDFRSNREMNSATVKKLILKRFNTFIPNYTCWRGLKLMRQIVEGRHEDGYKLLPQYMEVFKGRNPDSECFIRWEEIGPGRNPMRMATSFDWY